MTTLTAKENYLMMIRGELPEFVPAAAYFPHRIGVEEELLTPQSAPLGTVVTSFGVEYTGSKDMNMGAMPTPGKIILPDITNWDKYIKRPDTSDRNWEMYYKAQEEKWDRENKLLYVGGGDYFLTAVSFMGYEDTMLAMYEEPDAFKEMLEYVSDFYLEVLKKQIYYCKPDALGLMDDDSAYHAPFFSLEMYREFFKPLQQKHIDIAHENGMYVERHDCGKCELFVPDWVEQGVKAWNPAQPMNDLKGIHEKYVGKLAICGGWDSQGVLGSEKVDIKVLKDALVEYVDTLAPGGSFGF